ncbi:PTS sugar transporter subunit IIA, partial [Vibrio campbellii]
MDILNLIEPETICLDLQAQTKDEALKELVELLDAAGKLTSKSQFLADIWKR